MIQAFGDARSMGNTVRCTSLRGLLESGYRGCSAQQERLDLKLRQYDGRFARDKPLAKSFDHARLIQHIEAAWAISLETGERAGPCLTCASNSNRG